MVGTSNLGSKNTNNNYQVSNNCTTVPTRFHSFPSYIPVFLDSSSYLVLALQDFTTSTTKSQHLQSGFRFLLSVRLFLQALLAICGFFRFCYSCLYRVRLDLQWQEWGRWIVVNLQGHSRANSSKFEIHQSRRVVSWCCLQPWLVTKSSTSAGAVCASLHW